MRRKGFWISVFVVLIAALAAYWRWQPLRIERTVIAKVPPNFSDWIATDLDGDSNAEVLLTYPNKPPLLLRLSETEATTTPLPDVIPIMPSVSEIKTASLPLVRAMPVKIWNGYGFQLMRWRNNRPVFEPFPKVSKPSYAIWLDADRDGKANDLIVRSGQKRFWFVLNERGEWQFKVPLPSGSMQPLTGAGDIDGDGKPEFVGGTNLCTVSWGDGKTKTVLGKLSTELQQVQLTDVEGDGRKEIVALKREGSKYRLVVWAFDVQQKRLAITALSSPLDFSVSLVSQSGQVMMIVAPMDIQNVFWVQDLDGDGRKEFVVAEKRLSGLVIWLGHHRARLLGQLHQALQRLVSPAPSSRPILVSPAPFSQPQPTGTRWHLVFWDGRKLRTKEGKLPKGLDGRLPPVATPVVRGQRWLVVEWEKPSRRFHPRLLSLNPLQVTWWDEGWIWCGSVWGLPEGKDALDLSRWMKVTDLPGKPLFVTDLNDDGFPEIFWFRREVWFTFPTSKHSDLMGIASFDGWWWRQAQWRCLIQKESQQVIPGGVSSFVFFTQPFEPTVPIHFLLLPEGNRKTLLIALSDGTIEQVQVR